MSELDPLLDANGSSVRSITADNANKKVSFKGGTIPLKDTNSRYPKRQQAAHARYQSSVVHLPKQLTTPTYDSGDYSQVYKGSPITSQTSPIEQSASPTLDILDNAQKKSQYIPFKQLFLLYFNMVLFVIAIIFAVISIVLEYSVFTSSIIIGIVALLIIVSISGLVLSVSYRNAMFRILILTEKVSKYMTSSKIEVTVEERKDSDEEDIPISPKYAKISLLQSFMNGQINKELFQVCSGEDLKQLLPVVLS